MTVGAIIHQIRDVPLHVGFIRIAGLFSTRCFVASLFGSLMETFYKFTNFARGLFL